MVHFLLSINNIFFKIGLQKNGKDSTDIPYKSDPVFANSFIYLYY